MKFDLMKVKNRKLTAEDLYRQFQDSLHSFKPRSWTVSLFEGSPTGGLYSWCPDCVVAAAQLGSFEKRDALLLNQARLLNFKIGSKREWESKQILNPFRSRFPFLSDIPTAVLFFGRLDVMRLIAPQAADLRYLFKRAKTYEEQMKSKECHPPVKYR